MLEVHTAGHIQIQNTLEKRIIFMHYSDICSIWVFHKLKWKNEEFGFK